MKKLPNVGDLWMSTLTRDGIKRESLYLLEDQYKSDSFFKAFSFHKNDYVTVQIVEFDNELIGKLTWEKIS